MPYGIGRYWLNKPDSLLAVFNCVLSYLSTAPLYNFTVQEFDMGFSFDYSHVIEVEQKHF